MSEGAGRAQPAKTLEFLMAGEVLVVKDVSQPFSHTVKFEFCSPPLRKIESVSFSVDTLETLDALPNWFLEKREDGISCFIIDLHEVTFVSSSFIGVLLRLIRRGAKVLLVAAPREVHEILPSLHLSDLIPCFETIEQAVEDYEKWKRVE